MRGHLTHRYLIALGSNVRHSRHGGPRAVLAAAVCALSAQGLTILAVAPIMSTAPIGPSGRRYANGAAIVESGLAPDELLRVLQALERRFGRRRSGQRWRARVLDCDIVLWSGGAWSMPELTIPHLHFRDRTFVLGPARAIAAGWRDPLSGLTVAHLHARLTRPRHAPRASATPRPKR